jgi:CspA family cold shock protein
MKKTGRIKWFNREKGYGFIEADDLLHILVKCPDIETGYGVHDLRENEIVSFKVMESFSGPYAIGVTRISCAS